MLKKINIRYHVGDARLDDALSLKMYDLYLKSLDPRKQFFIGEDLRALEKYKYKQDDAVQLASVEFIALSKQMLKLRYQQVRNIINDYLERPVNFYRKLKVVIDPDQRKHMASFNALTRYWQHILSYSVMQNYIELYEEKFSDKPLNVGASINKELEIKARQNVKEEFLRMLDRLEDRDDEDYFSTWLNAFSQSLDPHSAYFPPEDQEDFEIRMSGQLEGIGAVLQEDKGYVKVVKIVVGGAAWRQKELEVEDVILKVSQEDGEWVSMLNLPIRDAVKHIRGKKNTRVKLTIKKPTGKLKVLEIVRDVVVIEESYAKGYLLKVNDNQAPIAYISLPSFYRDFSNKTKRNSSDDIKALISTFKNHPISGMILDFRRNGGGSLRDAVEISGLFIKEGPIVQVKGKQGRVRTLVDDDTSIAYSGPLLVLTSHQSASASEIVAAALKDYNRAIILGPDHSFGKGTVQQLINLDEAIRSSWIRPSVNFGSVKLTVEEFFRVNGQSTQFKGVNSDIVVPQRGDYLKIGEKFQDYALPYSYIEPSSYNPLEPKGVYKLAIQNSKKRIEKSKAFKYIKESNYQLEKKLSEPISLYFTDILEHNQYIESLNNDIKESSHLNYDLEILPKNKAAETDVELKKSLLKDLMLQEAVAVIQDIDKLNSRN